MPLPFPPSAFPPANLPCSDEDVMVAAPDDYFDLVPRAFVLASGSDGSIGPTNVRTLASATDFAGQGVFPGAAIRLWAEPMTDAGRRLGTEGSGFPALVASCNSTTVTTRAPGMLAGMGDPPGVAGTTFAGLSFRVVSVVQAIASAAAEVDRLLDYGASADPDDPEERRELTFLLTLYYLYEAAARQAGNNQDSFRAKAAQYIERYTASLRKDVAHRSGGAISAPINVAYPWGYPVVNCPTNVGAPRRPVYPSRPGFGYGVGPWGGGWGW